MCKLKKMANGPKETRGEGEDGEASESEEERASVGDEEGEDSEAEEKPTSKAAQAAAKGGRLAGSKRSASEQTGQFCCHVHINHLPLLSTKSFLLED